MVYEIISVGQRPRHDSLREQPSSPLYSNLAVCRPRKPPGACAFTASESKKLQSGDFLMEEALHEVQQAEGAHARSIEKLSALAGPGLEQSPTAMAAPYREKAGGVGFGHRGFEPTCPVTSTTCICKSSQVHLQGAANSPSFTGKNRRLCGSGWTMLSGIDSLQDLLQRANSVQARERDFQKTVALAVVRSSRGRTQTERRVPRRESAAKYMRRHPSTTLPARSQWKAAMD
jgi:hypothetical protein